MRAGWGEKEESRVTPSITFNYWVVDGGRLGKDGGGAGLATGTQSSVWVGFEVLLDSRVQLSRARLGAHV